MHDKETRFRIIDRTVVDAPLEKVAAEDYDPDFIYIKVRAISAGEFWGPNKNADYFPEAELKKSYSTFLNAHVFKNHENKQVENSIGDVLDAVWDDKMKYVELFIRIDKKLAPSVARGFEKGTITDVSMGCKVKYTVCSICGNKAAKRSEFCEHVKTRRNEVLHDGKRVYEVNYEPSFHDISAVLSGADRTAKQLEKVAVTIMKRLSFDKSLVKAASIEDEQLAKVASAETSADFSMPHSLHIDKIAEIKKNIIDRLFTLRLLKKLEKEKSITKQADISSMNLSKHPVPRALAAGAVGIAAANARAKQGRGEYTNTAENVLAAHPIAAPIATYLAAPHVYNTAKNLLNKHVADTATVPKAFASRAPRAAGAIGITALGEHYRMRQLRGEETSPTQDLLASHPVAAGAAYYFGAPYAYGAAKKGLSYVAKGGAEELSKATKGIVPRAEKTLSKIKFTGLRDLVRHITTEASLFDDTVEKLSTDMKFFSPETKAVFHDSTLAGDGYIDIFKDASIQEELSSLGYKPPQIQALKYASVLLESEDPRCSDVLKREGLSTADLSTFLKISSVHIDSVIEKVAYNMIRNMFEDSFWQRDGKVLAASPFLLADALAVKGIMHKLKPKGEGEVQPEIKQPSEALHRAPSNTITQ